MKGYRVDLADNIGNQQHRFNYIDKIRHMKFGKTGFLCDVFETSGLLYEDFYRRIENVEAVILEFCITHDLRDEKSNNLDALIVMAEYYEILTRGEDEIFENAWPSNSSEDEDDDTPKGGVQQ